MTDQNIILDIEKYLYKLRSNKNNIDEYYNKELRDLTIKSKKIYLIAICKLFETGEQRNRTQRFKDQNPEPLENVDINKLTIKYINDFLKCEWFNRLSNTTKNQLLVKIKKYLTFSDREDLVEAFGKKRFKEEKKVLSKNDLISREDLELILKHCNQKLRTLLMVLYEGALRKDEALNIRFRDIQFNGGYTILRVIKSKTQKRDIPLIESTPYLKEYFFNQNFEPNDKIFPYNWGTSINSLLYNLVKRLSRKYPAKWKGRKLYPHLFRHTRLTELAAGKLNEAQIRKFAGWKPGSLMPEVYFHLDDKDVINILTNGEINVPEPKKFKEITCPICKTENNEQNVYCWKCENLLEEEKIGVLKNKLENMERLVNQLIGAIEGLGTKIVILPKEEDVLPGDIEGLPERREIKDEEVGNRLANTFKEIADKIMKY